MSGYYEPAPAFGSPLRARLLSPNWELIASHLGRPVPPVLHSLYEPPDGVLRSHCRVFPSDGAKELWLDMFLPMDEMAVAPDGVRLPPGSVAFADDEHGDPYVFVPGESGDGPVYLRCRQDGEAIMVPVAPALSTFLGWERRQAG
ncbi:MAG: SMI1/KNR4 family protein [Gemmatimonadales bacterium]